MERITYKELKKKFLDHERTSPETHLTGCIVFTVGSFKNDYSLEERTYEVSSNNKAFKPNMGGYSIFGSCAADNDFCRLEHYMEEEYGGEDGWKVDYCYLKEDPEESPNENNSI